MPKIKISPAGMISLLIIFLLNGKHTFGIMILCAFVHELGHLIVMLLLGVKPLEVTVGFMNFNICYNKLKTSYKVDIFISMAGIVFNLIFGAVSYFAGNTNLFVTNCVLAVVNLIPIKGLDGGNIINSIISAVKSDGAEKGDAYFLSSDQYSGKIRLYSKIFAPVFIFSLTIASGFNVSVAFSGVSMLICECINSG